MDRVDGWTRCMCYVIRRKLRRNQETERNLLGWTRWMGGRDACVIRKKLKRNGEIERSFGWTGWTGGRDGCVTSLERN